jgi:hypothetical protein
MPISYYTIILFIALFYVLLVGSAINYFSSGDESLKFKSTVLVNSLVASSMLAFNDKVSNEYLFHGLIAGSFISQVLDTYRNNYESISDKDKLTYYSVGSFIFVCSILYLSRDRGEKFSIRFN